MVGSKVITYRLNITEKLLIRKNLKRWVMAFDPAVSFKPIPYKSKVSMIAVESLEIEL